MRKMTEGNIYGHLLSTAVPLIMGNILQLTYNAVDSIIVSKGVGVDGLGAVSVSEPVSTIGMGQMTMTLICTVIQISVRTIMVFLLVPNIGIRGEAWGSALGWIIMSVFEYGYYFTVQQRRVYRKS